MVTKNNGFFEAYHSPMLTTIKKSLAPELRGRREAKAKLAELQGSLDSMASQHQQAIAEHERLLTELETSPDPVKAARALAGHEQEKAALRQGLHFLRMRVENAKEVVKAAQTLVDARFKTEIVKLHQPFQAEIDEVAKRLAGQINEYERAVATITNVNIGVGFLVASKRSKPWLSLRLPGLEDYV